MVAPVHVGTGFEQQSHDGLVAESRSDHEWRRAIAFRKVYVDVLRCEILHDCKVVASCGDMNFSIPLFHDDGPLRDLALVSAAVLLKQHRSSLCATGREQALSGA